tara:strand:+ start:4287 stop:4481 length:195 start_codon:yes stop_codon:yes gene_type:complete
MNYKNLFYLLGLAFIAVCNISCETTDAKVGLPVPFTDPAVRVALDVKAAVIPPKFCIGLDIKED